MSTTPHAMTEFVDSLRGAVRVSGHLTAQGADLLRGTVESLCRGGHRRVLVDLRDVQATDIAGLQVLHDMERDLAADGARLLLQPPAGWTRPSPLGLRHAAPGPPPARVAGCR